MGVDEIMVGWWGVSSLKANVVVIDFFDIYTVLF